MLYQLTTGKTIFISLEHYLKLDDEAFHQLIQGLEGDYVSPDANFTGSTSAKQQFEENFDTSLDFEIDDDEAPQESPVNLSELPDFDF